MCLPPPHSLHRHHFPPTSTTNLHTTQSLHTFGFRGEALSSLAALGGLTVITRTAEQAAATRLEFDRDGRLTSSTPVARAVGTTVAVKDLFSALPVRRQVGGAKGLSGGGRGWWWQRTERHDVCCDVVLVSYKAIYVMCQEREGAQQGALLIGGVSATHTYTHTCTHTLLINAGVHAQRASRGCQAEAAAAALRHHVNAGPAVCE